MNTIKTAIVVLALLAVLYGAYTFLNKPENLPLLPDLTGPATPGPEIAAPQFDLGSPMQPPALQPPAGIQTPVLEVPSAPEIAQGASGQLSPASGGPFPNQPVAFDRETPADPPSVYALPTEVKTGEPTVGAYELPSMPASSASGSSIFERNWQTAQGQLASENYRDALFTLSVFYNSNDLSEEQSKRLIDLLDPLAAKVIYSREHTIERAHIVKRGETLTQIAQQYQVPSQVLGAINGVQNTSILTAGTELKVFHGPFRAEIDSQTSELTLFLGRLYAGRFAVAFGDLAPPPATYQVRDKQFGRTYFGPNNQTLPPEHPENPYGRCWLQLNDQFAVHGSSTSGGIADSRGSISLSPADADDIFGILSIGSTVLVR